MFFLKSHRNGIPMVYYFGGVVLCACSCIEWDEERSGRVEEISQEE